MLDAQKIEKKRYSPESLITHRYYQSAKVVLEHPAVMPAKNRPVTINEAYYHLGKWKFVGLKIDEYVISGPDLHTLVYRMLKHQCLHDEELLGVIEQQVPSAFYKIDGGGKIKTRVQGSVGLRSDATLSEIWRVLHCLVTYSYNSKVARLYAKIDD